MYDLTLCGPNLFSGFFLNFQQVLVKLTYLQNHLTYFDYFFKEILLRKLSYFNA